MGTCQIPLRPSILHFPPLRQLLSLSPATTLHTFPERPCPGSEMQLRAVVVQPALHCRVGAGRPDLPRREAAARTPCTTVHLIGETGPEASKRSCQHGSWGSSCFSILSRKAAVLCAQGHAGGRLCLFQSIFLHSPHVSQGTQNRDFDDYSFLLLFCGISCPQNLTNNIFFSCNSNKT